MNYDEIKALIGVEPADGEEDNRFERILAEIEARDSQIADKDAQIASLTSKIADMAETNSKLVEQVKYVEPDPEKEEKSEEDGYEFADLEEIYEED